MQTSAFRPAVALVAMTILATCMGMVAQDATPSIGSNATSSADVVFAPFPSHLRVGVHGNAISLNWIDSQEAASSYLIYRYKDAIGALNFDLAVKIGSVAPGVQAFEDSPPDGQGYYYLILAAGTDGKPFKVFIPSRNASGAPVAIQTPALAASPTPLPAPQQPPSSSPIPQTASTEPITPASPQRLIDNILAAPKGDAVIVSFKAAKSGLRLVLYRGEHPLKSAADLLDAALVASFQDKDGTFADYPVPGIEYFYAILVQDELKAGRIELVTARNSTDSAVRIASSARAGGFTEVAPTSRTPPLPSFLMDQAPGIDSSRLPQSSGPPPIAVLLPETEKAIAGILARIPVPTTQTPGLSILPAEVNSPSGGESYALSVIVTEKLIPGDWTASVDQLQKYLSLNRSPDASARAHFYLGQALVHQGQWRDAFFEFLSAREYYTVECKPWLEFVLSVLHKS